MLKAITPVGPLIQSVQIPPNKMYFQKAHNTCKCLQNTYAVLEESFGS